MDEFGNDLGNAEVWTGTFDLGLYEGNSCSDFTYNGATSPFAAVGLSGAAGFNWSNAYLQFCNRTNVHLYCVEQ